MNDGHSHFSRRSMLWRALTASVGAAAGRSKSLSTMASDQSGDGVEWRPTDEVHISVRAPGSNANGKIDDLEEILRAAQASRIGVRDDIGRVLAGEIKLPPGRYRISGPLDLAPASGVIGLTISGAGTGTEILFDGGAATVQCSSSRGVTFRDLTFRSIQGVDADQTAFTINQHGNPLRSWRFERCDFTAFNRCFAVTGASMTSEFYFDKCQFLQCYYLMDNENEQAVNWNFINCNWENGELLTDKDHGLSAAFLLKKGTFVKWTGGSIVFHGRLILYDLKIPGSVQRPSHMMTFDGVRIELEAKDGVYVPFVDRIDAGYVSGTNQPTTVFSHCTILQRGTVPSVVYARAWANCSLSFVDCKAKGGRVIGVLDHLSPSQTASIRLENTRSIVYEEDTTSRLNSHDQHHVQIVPDGSAASGEPIIDQRPCSLTAPATMHPKFMYIRGPTGSLPLGGTVVDLIDMPDHTMFMRIFVQRFQPAGERLSVELRDRSRGAVYGTAILATGMDRFVEARIGAEMGFQIPSGTPLVLRFVGVPEIVKGIVGIEYL